jgi:hypothetical protein
MHAARLIRPNGVLYASCAATCSAGLRAIHDRPCSCSETRATCSFRSITRWPTATRLTSSRKTDEGSAEVGIAVRTRHDRCNSTTRRQSCGTCFLMETEGIRRKEELRSDERSSGNTEQCATD